MTRCHLKHVARGVGRRSRAVKITLGWVCADPTENLLFVSKAILVTPAECTNRRADTSVINFLDRCAITVPIRTVGPPLGLMIVGEHGGDRHLLGVGRSIEAALNRTL